jgi:putative heme iron utilization protein
MDQNPNISIMLRETAQRKKKVTSRSKIINKMETR